MAIEVEVISDYRRFLGLEREWNDLVAQSQHTSFFLSHAWFRCCWPQVERRGHVSALVARENGTMLGIAPIVTHGLRWRRLPARAVSLLQNQDSPFADVILHRDRSEEALTALLRHLEESGSWDVLCFCKVPRWSPTHPLLRHVLAGRRFLCAESSPCPFLATDGTWDSFWTWQSKHFKKTVRNVANRTERLGAIQVEELDTHAPLDECVDAFRKVAGASWKANLPTNPVRNPGIGLFFESLTTALRTADRLALWVLRADAKPVATEYHVRDGAVVYALRSDFVTEHSAVSPGAYLKCHIIRSYFEREGVRVYDMGPGDRAYKQRWASDIRRGDTFWVFNRSPYSLALYAIEARAVPILRRVRERWRPGAESLPGTARAGGEKE